MEDIKKSFLEIGRGAILERFDYELEKVVDNILDANTPSTKPRKVQLTLTLKPADDRQTITHEVVVKSTLQPTSPIVGATAIMDNGMGGTGLFELTPQIPGQGDIYGGEQRQPDVIQFKKKA